MLVRALRLLTNISSKTRPFEQLLVSFSLSKYWPVLAGIAVRRRKRRIIPGLPPFTTPIVFVIYRHSI